MEVIEVDAARGSRLTARRLADVGLPPGILVVAVRRGETLRVAQESDRVEPGDRVVLVVATPLVGRVTEFL